MLNQQLIQQIMNNLPQIQGNPIVQNALQLAQSNNVNGLRNLAENICREKGIDINEIAKQYGIKI